MLIGQSLKYLLVIGVPGIINFTAMMIFTRLLTAAEYGRYALVIAGVGIAHVVIFQWLQMIIARFLPEEHLKESEVLKAVFSIFIALSVLFGLIGILLVFFFPGPEWKYLLALAVPLVLANSWLQINMTVASAQVTPARYGALLGVRSVVALVIGYGFAVIGYATKAPILGLLVGTVLACIFFTKSTWRGILIKRPPPQLLKEYIAYGLPLVITFFLGWVLSTSDRILISWFIDEAATGIYAASYDMAQQSLGVLLGIVNTAAYPLVMRKMSNQGVHAAKIQLKKNGVLVITIALSGALVIIALSSHMAHVFLGVAFQAEAAIILPWIAASSAITAIKAFHFDLAFQLSKKSKWQIYTSAAAVITNMILCLLLIPRYGMLGAAWATLAACIVATGVSAYIGNKVFPMPNLAPILSQAIPVAVLTYFGAWLIAQSQLNPFGIVIIGLISGVILGLMGAILLYPLRIQKDRRYASKFRKTFKYFFN
jgi:O-antigen/teichoic acid export membrane protein